MIKPGRPPRGYSVIENIFYILNKELNQIHEILKDSISGIKYKYEKEKQKNELKLEAYYKKAKELTAKFLNEEEEPIVAHDIAYGEAMSILGMYPDLFDEQMENNTLVFEQSIDQLIKSTIVMVYSVIEYSLNKICMILEKQLNTNIKLDDLKNRGYIGTYFIFFEKVALIDFDKLEYSRFQKFQNVRNNIVHANSTLERKEIIQILQSYKQSIRTKDGRYHFNNDYFVTNFIKTSKKLINSLEKGIKELDENE